MLQKKQLAVEAALAPLRVLETKTPDLFEKCRRYTTAREVMAAGLYPYFHVVESEQSPEVIVEGRKMIMLGSNNYLYPYTVICDLKKRPHPKMRPF